MITPHDVAAPQGHALPTPPTYAAITAGPTSAAHHVASSQQFVAKGGHVNPLSKATATSSPLIWRSKEVNAGEGHLASQGKANIGSNLDTGF